MIDHCHIAMTSGHKWFNTNAGRVEILNGDKNASVFVKETIKGFLWCYKKRCGYFPTLNEAKDFCEALAEFDSGKGFSYLQITG